jgi:quercetin dioxygenase-like cupin family protein
VETHAKHSEAVPFDFYGLSIRELSPTSSSQASVAEIEVPPGGAHPQARSTASDKLYVGVEGKVTFHLHDRVQSLEHLDVLLIKKGEWFSYSNDTGEAARLLLVHVPPFDVAAEEIRA